MYLSRNWVIILAIVLVAAMGFCIGRYAAASAGGAVESLEIGRVGPLDPLRHPGDQRRSVFAGSAFRKTAGLNEMVDRIMDTYFDQEGYPFDETRELFLRKLQIPYNTSVVQPQTLYKLNDVAYYVIRQVIPRCATTSVAEQADMVWPPIVWSDPNTARLLYNSTIQPYGTFGISSSSSSRATTGSAGSTGSSGSTTTGSDGSSIGGSGSASKTVAKGRQETTAGCNVKGPCGQPCPTSCIDAALMSAKTPESAPKNITSPTQVGVMTQNLNKRDLAEWWSLFTEDQEDGTPSNVATVQPADLTSRRGNNGIRSAKIDNIKVVGPPYDEKLLNDYLIKNIETYFDSSTGVPTAAFIKKFQSYTQGQPPMDQAHMNKLTDMVYYLMETVVSGLPTPANPYFQFVWNPISRLSQRTFLQI
jgi:hypothetical protein